MTKYRLVNMWGQTVIERRILGIWWSLPELFSNDKQALDFLKKEINRKYQVEVN